MARNTDVNTFLLDDHIELVRETWKKGMSAMKDSGTKDDKGKYSREADWTTRIKMMAFWKECTVIRSREVDTVMRSAKSVFDSNSAYMKEVRRLQRVEQEKVN